MQVKRLAQIDRAVLLNSTGIGQRMVDLIEAAGYESLLSIRLSGVDRVLEDVCVVAGTRAFMHRRRALNRVLQAYFPSASAR